MHTNRLIEEKSPYLLQHAHNPVDWLAWGEAAFEKARAEDKPVFLSIGYSTCHWCHVMERESFESEEVAEVLNRHFVSIKVDREERPDIDRIYMTFVQATTGSGGWPMSVWMTPDGKPFYGGTYFPPDNRYGRPGFRSILEYIGKAWSSDRPRILESSQQVFGELEKMTRAGDDAASWMDETAVESCFQVFRRTYDARLGGFGGAPKFPRPVAYNFLLRHAARSGNAEGRDMVLHTLREMAKGGMYDQVGGGFHRYSVDERWFVSHFEKMLYDQAQLAVSYIEAFQITGEEQYARVARDIFRYVRRDLTHPEGAFFSAEDADSIIDPADPHEKGEGAFYIWAESELRQVLGEDAGWFGECFGVEPQGNVANDPQAEFVGRNILYQAKPLSEAPSAEAVRSALDKLLAARAKRPRPHLDDKVLTSWNGLMISAYALGARVLDPSYAEDARRAADFVLANLWSDGLLLRRYRDGEAAIPGFLDDYAFFAASLIDLYEATFEARYLRAAMAIASAMIERFEDGERGGFYSTASDAEQLILRLKDDYDGAEPGGNSAAMLMLLRLGAMTGEDRFSDAARRALKYFAARLRAAPHAMPQMMVAYLYSLVPPGQVVLAGEAGEAGFEALAGEARRRFLPNHVIVRADEAVLPKTAGMGPVEGVAAAYVCQDFTCQLPVSDAAKLGELLGQGMLE